MRKNMDRAETPEYPHAGQPSQYEPQRLKVEDVGARILLMPSL